VLIHFIESVREYNWASVNTARHSYDCEVILYSILDWQIRRDADDVTESGRLCYARAAATEKARSPILERALAGTISATIAAERSHRRDSTSASAIMGVGQYCGHTKKLAVYSKLIFPASTSA